MKLRALVSSFLRAVVCIGAVSGGLRQFAAPPQVLEPPLHLTPSEIEIYKGAQTLIDWTPRQIHDCPFLRKLRPTGSQDQLPMVLERVGQTVTLLFHDFPRIACDEVASEAHPEQRDSLSPEGVLMRETSETTERQKLRYIVIPGPVGDVPTVDFYPVQPSGSERLLWLPCDVTVVLVYRGTQVRNTHHYSNFKLFRVESTIKPGG